MRGLCDMERKPVLYAVIREDSNHDIFGKIAHSADSKAVLEALALIITEFSKSCELSPQEICDDLKTII